MDLYSHPEVKWIMIGGTPTYVLQYGHITDDVILIIPGINNGCMSLF